MLLVCSLLVAWLGGATKRAFKRLVSGEVEFVGDIQREGGRPILFNQKHIPQVTAYIPELKGQYVEWLLLTGIAYNQLKLTTQM
jgi:hypothetical protein